MFSVVVGFVLSVRIDLTTASFMHAQKAQEFEWKTTSYFCFLNILEPQSALLECSWSNSEDCFVGYIQKTILLCPVAARQMLCQYQVLHVTGF